jgi:hypothetical protein
VRKDLFLHSSYSRHNGFTHDTILQKKIKKYVIPNNSKPTPHPTKMSFHATYNPHLLAPPTQRHHPHHPHNRITQNAQASESTASLNTGLRAKLRSALELQKHAHFDVKINIHEISNVPQLQGEFCCHWHFRGKSPKVRDGGAGESDFTRC